jgi:hypothetical protein
MNSGTPSNKNWMSGNMNSNDICTIIEACSKCGVVNFKVDSLEIDFGKSISSSPEGLPTNAPSKEQIDILQQVISKQALALDDYKARKSTLELLPLTDPVAYDELAMSGKLDTEEDGEDLDDQEA